MQIESNENHLNCDYTTCSRWTMEGFRKKKSQQGNKEWNVWYIQSNEVRRARARVKHRRSRFVLTRYQLVNAQQALKSENDLRPHSVNSKIASFRRGWWWFRELKLRLEGKQMWLIVMHAFVYVASYVRLPHRVNEPGEESFYWKIELDWRGKFPPSRTL